jgi:hypothetical protein
MPLVALLANDPRGRLLIDPVARLSAVLSSQSQCNFVLGSTLYVKQTRDRRLTHLNANSLNLGGIGFNRVAGDEMLDFGSRVKNASADADESRSSLQPSPRLEGFDGQPQ